MSRQTFLSLLTCAVLLFVFIFTGSYQSKNYKSYNKIIITVSKNDTLWGIAKKHDKRRDIRKTINEIKEMNGLSDAIIYPGQQLVINKGIQDI